jgi:hypothetical protein
MGTTSPKLMAVVVAALLHFFLGAAWFTVFKEPWLAGTGKTMEQLMGSGMPAWMPYVVTFIADLVMAYVLGWLIQVSGSSGVSGGLLVAGLAWLGFVASAFATEYVFEARSLPFFGINAGYPLVGMMIMGVVLGAWKK